jgi:hypothetical protein
MSSELILYASAVAVLALAGLVYTAGLYYASKELSKLTSDVLRGWTDD